MGSRALKPLGMAHRVRRLGEVETSNESLLIVIVMIMAVSVMAVIMVMILIVGVPVAIMVPVVVVFNSTSVSLPVAHEVSLPFVMRRYPMGSLVRRPSPVPLMPFVAPSHWIPITFHPYEFRRRLRRFSIDHTRRWRWRAKCDSN